METPDFDQDMHVTFFLKNTTNTLSTRLMIILLLILFMTKPDEIKDRSIEHFSYRLKILYDLDQLPVK